MQKFLSILRSPIIPIIGTFLSIIGLSYIKDGFTAAAWLAVFLSITLISLFLSELRRRKTEIFIFAAFSSGMLILGRFDYSSPWFEAVGAFGLIFSAFLNGIRKSD